VSRQWWGELGPLDGRGAVANVSILNGQGTPCLRVCRDPWLCEDGISSAVFGLLWYLRMEAQTPKEGLNITRPYPKLH